MAKWYIASLMVVILAATPALAREQVRIVGSSTVFPFVSAAAEQFGRMGYRTPIVEANGTGGGFKMFCHGVGEEYPDISNASRPIKDSERALCAKHGVNKIMELTIGYDGIVIANHRASSEFKFSKRALFLALARMVPKDGQLVNNPYRRWSEIDPKLPDTNIEVYGPPPAEGTRDALVEMVMHEGCEGIAEYRAAYPDEKLRKQHCGAMREDGHFVELLGGNVMVQKLLNNKEALGIFSYSYLDQNRALVKANPVDGVMPTLASIVSQHYGVARSLFVYVKQEQLGQTQGLKEFVQFLISDAASGEDGFLIVKGLLPLPEAQRRALQARAATLE